MVRLQIILRPGLQYTVSGLTAKARVHSPYLGVGLCGI